jgi:uncharacterized RDD family membrane protein YckC
MKRALAGVVDAGPTLLFVIFGVGVADAVGGGPTLALYIALFIYVVYHAAFNVLWFGETPGRRMLHIRLVGSRGDELTRARAVARPIVRVVWIAAFIPVAFGENMPIVVLAPIITDLFLMSVLPWRQTTSDFICGTLVVNAPAVQPHRAPAGPMYSATDREFGIPPRRHE